MLAALRLQYLQGDYSLHTSIPPLEEVYSLQRLKARISQSTKTFTPYERLEKRRTSFLEGTLRRSFRTGSVVRQKVEEEQMLDMWIKEEVCSARASIIDKWKKLQGVNQEQAMAKYMALIKEWPGYGSTLFDVEVRAGCADRCCVLMELCQNLNLPGIMQKMGFEGPLGSAPSEPLASSCPRRVFFRFIFLLCFLQ